MAKDEQHPAMGGVDIYKSCAWALCPCAGGHKRDRMQACASEHCGRHHYPTLGLSIQSELWAEVTEDCALYTTICSE